VCLHKSRNTPVSFVISVRPSVFSHISAPLPRNGFSWNRILGILTKIAEEFGIWLNLRAPCSRVLLEKLTGSQLVKKFLTFYGTRRFITAFTSARHLHLYWASSIQSIPLHPNSRRSILIFSSHLHLGLPVGFFSSDVPTKTLYTPLLSPIRATCSAHLILLDFITRTILGEGYRSLNSSLCNFFLLLPTWYTNFLFIHTNYIKLNFSTCFERNPLIFRRSTTQIVHMQPPVSSLSVSDRLVQPLKKTRRSLAESDDTRGCIWTICVVDLLMMIGLRSKHVEEFNLI